MRGKGGGLGHKCSGVELEAAPAQLEASKTPQILNPICLLLARVISDSPGEKGHFPCRGGRGEGGRTSPSLLAGA